jgi:hypothetical protein
MSGMLPVSCLSFPHLCGNVKALGWPFIADINLLTSWSRWNWDIYDRVHKNSLMGQYTEPAHTLLPCLSKICFYIIPAAEFGFRELYPSFKFSIEIFVRVSDCAMLEGDCLLGYDGVQCGRNLVASGGTLCLRLQDRLVTRL